MKQVETIVNSQAVTTQAIIQEQVQTAQEKATSSIALIQQEQQNQSKMLQVHNNNMSLIVTGCYYQFAGEYRSKCKFQNGKIGTRHEKYHSRSNIRMSNSLNNLMFKANDSTK